MFYSLPKISDRECVELPHFPTRHQAFIFRACEYVPVERIAQILRTTVDNINKAISDMGLPNYAPGDLWLKRGYITIIRRMWHILPYEQLTELLGLDSLALAAVMRDEDFLDVKLQSKPRCERVEWRELTEEEMWETKEIKRIMSSLSFDGKLPFSFEYKVPRISFYGEECFSTRMIYAFSGLYQHAFDVDSVEFLPDSQLEAYQALGINGIWTQGILSQLAEFPFDLDVSKGHAERRRRLRLLTERLDKYGIKLYLYLNEPRAMPVKFFDNYPELEGHVRNELACLCTSTEAVQNYLRDAVESICKEAPLLGGFFTITRSENLTNCYSHSGDREQPCTCPRCKERGVGEVVGETIACIVDGVRRVSNAIKVFAWSWRWDEHSEDIINCLPEDVILLSQSELDVPFDIAGVKGNVLDYSMSINGPGELARREWRQAKKRGLQIGAKVQINTTWEASTVPAIPVSPSVDEHIKRLKAEGVKHLLLSWTLGGYPCRNIAAAAKHFYESCNVESDSGNVAEAEKQFAKAFREFPFHIDVLYYGPQNAGPSNMLYKTPTGYRSTMTCFAYDDLDGWRGVYPIDTFESQLEKLCEGWKLGLDMLRDEDDGEVAVMARATYCLFKSSLNQVRFIRARDDGRFADAVIEAEKELRVAYMMLEQMNKNASIGYEAANHYYFSKGQIAEKIINCNYMIRAFQDKGDK